MLTNTAIRSRPHKRQWLWLAQFLAYSGVPKVQAVFLQSGTYEELRLVDTAPNSF
jgi:hypothetical protein